MVKILVFLGNPGKQYEKTRHNVGWMVCDTIPSDTQWQQKFHSLWTQVNLGNSLVRMLKPQTFMNESGRAVGEALKFFNIRPEEMVVIHDDLELPFGTLKLQLGGGLQGHNGLKSIKQQLGTDQFLRLRIGIGRPQRGDVASFVLSRFTKDEEIILPVILDRCNQLLQKREAITLPYIDVVTQP